MTASQIRHWMADDEGEQLEFKQNLLSRDEIAEYSVAIGNEGGGVLVMGITNSKPRRLAGVKSLSGDELQMIRRSVLDNARIRIDLYVIELDDGQVLAVRIPSRLPGTPFHTTKGKYLMRSGEDLRGMTPVELAEIFKEVAPPTLQAVPVGKLEPVIRRQQVEKVDGSHTYRLQVSILNTGSSTARSFCLEVLFPRLFSSDAGAHILRVQNGGPPGFDLYRVTQESLSAAEIHPGQSTPVLIQVAYAIDQILMDQRSSLLQQPVTATVWSENLPPCSVSRPIGDLR